MEASFDNWGFFFIREGVSVRFLPKPEGHDNYMENEHPESLKKVNYVYIKIRHRGSSCASIPYTVILMVDPLWHSSAIESYGE